MDKITLKTGEVLEFEKLTYVKDNTSKTDLTVNGQDCEGIWIVLSDKDKEDMKNNKKDGYFVAMLANHAVNFYPYPSWGLHIVCKHNGNNRCLSDREWVDYLDEKNRHFTE